MTLTLRWIEDAETRPRAMQPEMFPSFCSFCCAEVARERGWSWGKAARAMRRLTARAPGSSMKGVRIDGSSLSALTAVRELTD